MAHFLVEVKFKAQAGQEDLLEQRAFLERITADRSLLLAAMIPAHPGEGIAIIQADTLGAAEELYAQAPLAKKGIIGWTLTEITLTYGTASSSS